MSLPDGVESVTLTAGATGLTNPDGTAATGTVTLTPSVERVTSSAYGLIVLGPANATLSASGTFTLGPVLATDADGFTPTGWTYRIDENLTGQPPRSYSISLPAAAPSVALPDVAPTSISSGTTVSPSVLSVNGRTGTVTGLLEAGHNLSDLTSAVTARTNLGLGGAAVLNVGTSAGTVAAGDDSRLSEARTPTAHAATHAAAGGDPITIAQSQVTGLVSSLNALLPLSGGTLTGVLTVDNDLTVTNSVSVANTLTVGGDLAVTGDSSFGAYPTSPGTAPTLGAQLVDKTYTDGTFATQSTVTTLNGYVDDTVNRVAAIENGTASLAGLNVDGGAQVANGNLTITNFVKGYRYRTDGSALDWEGTGSDLVVSVWSGTMFNGTQHSYLRFSADAQNVQIGGRVEFTAALYGAVRHTLDGDGNTLGFHGATPVAQQAVTGSRGDGTALANLLTALATLGLIVDGTTA